MHVEESLLELGLWVLVIAVVGHSRVRALPCTQWEDLRPALQQQTGSSPQMPGKMLFGRMRPEVIESRVVGLDNFLQLCMVTPLYASCPVLTDFLTRGMDAPPPGLDLVDLGEAKFDAQAARGGGRAWSRVGGWGEGWESPSSTRRRSPRDPPPSHPPPSQP